MDVKKILIFSLAYYPRVGGAEVALKEITDRIPDIAFHMVTMRFSGADAAEETIGNVVVHRIGWGGYLSKILFPLLAGWKGRQLHRVHSFDGLWAMMSYMAIPISFFRNSLPYAITLQEGDTYAHMFKRLRVLPFLPLIRASFRSATVVQAISTYLGAWSRILGFKGPLEIIPNGVDVEKFTGASIAHEGVVLFTASRLVHKNAIDAVIRALPQVPEVRFVIAGVGEEEVKLKRLARTLGVENRIEFKGFVPHAQLPALLHAADMFIRPSRSEGMGNSFVEAFAAGVPVIATQEGGLRDFITAEVAWPVEKDRPDQIVQQIRAIMGNPAHVEKVVENARQLALQKYDWTLIARHMREKVFSKLFHA